MPATKRSCAGDEVVTYVEDGGKLQVITLGDGREDTSEHTDSSHRVTTRD